MRTRKILLLDTASLYFRAFYGVPDSLRSPDGLPVNAVRGLLDFVARLVDLYSPTHLACCWDNDWRPAWRVALLPSYKAHRVAGSPEVPAGSTSTIKEMASSPGTKGESAPDDLAVQVPWIREVLTALGIRMVGHDGYEADDVIGTLATTLPMPVDVVTGDRDLFQVVDDARQVRVLYIARGVGNHEQVDDAWVRGRYGVPASAYVDFATLRGDASDGLPGVPGVGDKTAASLIASYGDLDGILRAASEQGTRISPSVRAKLHAAIDYLAVAPEVVAVARDLDLGVAPDDLVLPTAPVDPEMFTALTERLGLGTSATRVLAALAKD
ncbi:5'-3' exonuclease [Microlunatus flavus]|uniref:5'-3' exonuclease n=1 Tax=Microlunatus flavus TaxID=1036181 RepID=A0A1H9FYD4_9ACTN|nr:5'-3' exonuclease [Microlunatus flavus]SEQ42935.1 5'-3' exonuclease [Microlunatus flavus]